MPPQTTSSFGILHAVSRSLGLADGVGVHRSRIRRDKISLGLERLEERLLLAGNSVASESSLLDVNGSGGVPDSRDGKLVFLHLSGFSTTALDNLRGPGATRRGEEIATYLNGQTPGLFDVNGDGKTTDRDGKLIFMHLSGFSSTALDNVRGPGSTRRGDAIRTYIDTAFSGTTPATTSVKPGTSVTITGSGFDLNSETTLVFTDAKGRELESPASAITSTTVTGPVPAFLNFDTFQIEAGEVSVGVRQITSSGTKNVTSLAQLQIQDLPQTGLPPGTLELRLLKEMGDLTAKAIADYQKVGVDSKGKVDVSEFIKQLKAQLAATTSMQADVQSLMDGSVKQIVLGQNAGQDIVLNRDSLALMDRQLANWATADSATPVILMSDSRMAAAQSSPSLSQQIADKAQAFAKSIDPGADGIAVGRTRLEGIRDQVFSYISTATAAVSLVAEPLGKALQVASAELYVGTTLGGMVGLAAYETLHKIATGKDFTVDTYKETLTFAKNSIVQKIVNDILDETNELFGNLLPNTSQGGDLIALAEAAVELAEQLLGKDPPAPNPTNPANPTPKPGPVAKSIEEIFEELQQGTVVDPGKPGLEVKPTQGLTTSEDGDTATFTVALTAKPLSTVDVVFTSSNPKEGNTKTQRIQFDANNWQSPSTVEVEGEDDGKIDGDVTYSISLKTESSESRYDGLTASVSLVNKDNAPQAGLEVKPTSGLETSEDGKTATFTIKLKNKPFAPVTVTLTSSNPAEGTVSPATVTFNDLNWNQPRTITVTGVDDSNIDGDVDYTITATAKSASQEYDGKTATVGTVNKDNEQPIIGIYTGSYTTHSGLVRARRPSDPSKSDIKTGQTWSGTVTLDIEKSVAQADGNLSLEGSITVTTINGTINLTGSGGFSSANNYFYFGATTGDSPPGQNGVITAKTEGTDLVGGLIANLIKDIEFDVSLMLDEAPIRLIKTG